MSIQVTSEDFAAGQPIPQRCSGEGRDESPALQWAHVPDQTRELALICDDPDAPTAEPWVHWILYGLPPETRQLPSGLPPHATLTEPVQARQGKNSWPSGQTLGYRGPLPPPGHGVHHYHFRVYALDSPLDLPPGIDQRQLLDAMRDHVLAQGELIGTYERR